MKNGQNGESFNGNFKYITFFWTEIPAILFVHGKQLCRYSQICFLYTRRSMFEVDSVQWNRSAIPYCPFTSFFAQGNLLSILSRSKYLPLLLFLNKLINLKPKSSTAKRNRVRSGCEATNWYYPQHIEFNWNLCDPFFVAFIFLFLIAKTGYWGTEWHTSWSPHSPSSVWLAQGRRNILRTLG